MYIGASINNSPTIAAPAGAVIQNGAGKAVKFDATGNIVLCSTAGEAALGILILQHADEVKAGDIVTVQIKDIGKVVAGGAIAPGALVTTDANGKFVTAATGNYVIGQAMGAGVADGFLDIQIIKGGQLN